MKSYINLVSVIFGVFFCVNSFSQTSRELFVQYKNQSSKLNSLYEKALLSLDVDRDEISKQRFKVFTLKEKLKNLKDIKKNARYFVSNKSIDIYFDLLDFYLYEWSSSSFRVIARIRCNSKKYTDFVKLRWKFYKGGSLVGTDYTYIDYETYGYSGMLPYHESYIESYTDTVDFETVTFEIDYTSKDGNGDIFWDQILKIESNKIGKINAFDDWFGEVSNNSNYSVSFPKIFACIFKDNQMIDLDYTYLDVQDNILLANSTGVFDSYIDLPDSYDDIKFYLTYSLYSLEGSGNITPNMPIFIEPATFIYNGTAGVDFYINLFLIDHESELMEVQMDWGEPTIDDWNGWYNSKYVSALYNMYADSGFFTIRAKARDATGNETTWSESRQVLIQPPEKLSIVTENLNGGVYLHYYNYSLIAQGGILPYTWSIVDGQLPSGININESNGIIAGIPDSSGTYIFTVSVTDNWINIQSDSAQFEIVINNSSPYFTSPDSVIAYVNTDFSYPISAIDPDANPITYSLIMSPSWLSLSNNMVIGLPPEGAVDTVFTIVASDLDLSDTLDVKLYLLVTHYPDICQNNSPKNFSLSQNYPNPFNMSTMIYFTIPKPCYVILKVYNLQGRVINTLIEERRDSGFYDIHWYANNLSSGIYLYRLETEYFSKTRKLIIQK